MGQIRRMDEHLATLIAAGEVVSGPISVVRELVDNALDAGATRVDIEIEHGGTRLIRVADDGQGMDADDARLCFERHATSKVATPDDLAAIQTLGFRGEALAAIMAVARVRLETRRASDPVGTFVRAAGGAVLESGSTARRPGTTLEVSELFFNTPARRSYLDSSAVEGRRVLQVVTRMALARPEVKFTLRSDAREVLDLSAVDDLLERVRQIHGAPFADVLLPLLAERGDVTVSGYITRPADGVRQPRRSAFIVNGRVFESPELRRVLFNALAAVAPYGRHPEAVVQIALPVTDLDANVSPDKSEVRFRLPGQVWAAVNDAVRYAFGGREAVAGFPQPEPALPADVQAQTRSQVTAGPPAMVDVSLRGTPATDVHSWELVLDHAAVAPGAVGEARRVCPEPAGTPPSSRVTPVTPPVVDAAVHRHGVPERPAAVFQVAASFLVCSVEDGLLVVDQHSAHERVNYERLRRHYETTGQPALQQRLLMPDVLRPDAEQAALLAEMQPYLERLGFELNVAGPREVWIQAVPASLGSRSAVAVLEQLIEAYLAARSTGVRASEATQGITTVEDRLLKTLACHGAVKAGQPLSETEIQALWRDLVHVDLACHDVHGRPAVLLVSATDLARRMGRALPFASPTA